MKSVLIILFISLLSLSVYGQAFSEKLIRQGVSLHDKGRYRDAIKCYEEALQVNPTSVSAVYEMALSYLQLKDYDKAVKYSSRIIDLNFQPLLADAYIVKSTALANQQKMNESVKLLTEAVVRCGDSHLLYFNLGLAYYNKKDYKMATVSLKKAIEIDPTKPSAFLLYAYALNDLDKWIESFYSFHFFLLLEPNTYRSKEAFSEMFDIISTDMSKFSKRLTHEEGIDRKLIYDNIQKFKIKGTSEDSKYKFFVNASRSIFSSLEELDNDNMPGLLWTFFVPTYGEILASGHFDTYCRYVSVSYFKESLEWWDKNKTEVDKFIEWFEKGKNGEDGEEDESDYGDDLELEDSAQN